MEGKHEPRFGPDAGKRIFVAVVLGLMALGAVRATEGVWRIVAIAVIALVLLWPELREERTPPE